MNQFSEWSRCAIIALAIIAGVVSTSSRSADATPGDFVAATQAAYVDARPQLENSPFHRPLSIDSEQSGARLTGSIEARLDAPFADVAKSLSDADGWCRIMLLMPNIADCHGTADRYAHALSVGLVRKFDDAPRAATPVRFSFDVDAQPDGLQVSLEAPNGPLGTRNYRIRLQAVPVADGQTFITLRYSDEYGWAARMAARVYMATSGADKIGFSSSGTSADGKPQYVGGLRGAIERNAMRCYLAIETYLSTAKLDDDARFGAALQRWTQAIAEYPAQLAEEDIDAYRRAKLRDAAAAASDAGASS
ncbi:hypothetical protein [Solimonas marina]|uniref:Uncharacterized protein n=1 Tax=Solimonas marina TaxID=2714601 RepID=A0A970BA10_9GAMM|nr:hypothetical protein [Solimonas marina]NKF23904.1 hypothetical protein [Solimonas marina]